LQQNPLITIDKHRGRSRRRQEDESKKNGFANFAIFFAKFAEPGR